MKGSCRIIKRVLTEFVSLTFLRYFVDFYGYWQEIRSLVRHDIRVTHNVHEIFEVAFCEAGKALVPASKDQDVEPLDNEAYERDDPVYPQDDTNQDPIDNSDEQLKTAGIMFVGEELVLIRYSFGHVNALHTVCMQDT